MGYWDLVANRLYYSVFHAVNAMMLADGLKTSTHKGISSQFGFHYVLTGKFSREEGILYSRPQTMREKADLSKHLHFGRKARQCFDSSGASPSIQNMCSCKGKDGITM